MAIATVGPTPLRYEIAPLSAGGPLKKAGYYLYRTFLFVKS